MNELVAHIQDAPALQVVLYFALTVIFIAAQFKDRT